MFTGDESGRFLVRALYEAGFANQPVSEARDDGLVYTECYVTAAVKCVPPQDKPTAEEFENCSEWLNSEFRLLTNARAVMALGRGGIRSLSRICREARGDDERDAVLARRKVHS